MTAVNGWTRNYATVLYQWEQNVKTDYFSWTFFFLLFSFSFMSLHLSHPQFPCTYLSRTHHKEVSVSGWSKLPICIANQITGGYCASTRTHLKSPSQHHTVLFLWCILWQTERSRIGRGACLRGNIRVACVEWCLISSIFFTSSETSQSSKQTSGNLPF